MATIEHVQPNSVASSSHQNGLIDQVNANTRDITSVTSNVTAHESRIETLESYGAAGSFMGQWVDDGEGFTQTFSQSGGHKVVGFTEPLIIPSGCSISNGTVTVSEGGLWMFTASTQYSGSSSIRALWLSKSANSSGSGLGKFGSIAGPSMDVQTATTVLRLNSGEQVSAYVGIWQGGSSIDLYEVESNTITAVWMGP